MTHLTVSVQWLNDAEGSATYHGDDWPPSPLRLFQALVAGYRGRGPREPRLDAALRHLEDLPAPTVLAPVPQAVSPVRAAVPNNDGDRTLGRYAAGDVAGARKSVSKLKTLRERVGWYVPGPVHYLWQASPETPIHLPALQELASGVTCLGQGVDLAWARLALLNAPPRLSGIAHVPRGDADNRLTVPYPAQGESKGAYDNLERRHDAFRQRIVGGRVSGVPEPHHALLGYRSILDLPPRRVAAFALRDMEGRAWSAPGGAGLIVAGMTRHAIHAAARRAGLQDSAIAALMGHGKPGIDAAERIYVCPVPNVGHAWADGRIRRVMLVAPTTVKEQLWTALIHRLIASDLIPEGAAAPVAQMVPADPGDTVLGSFTRRAAHWTSATPVVLPGWDTRRGQRRLERSAARLLRFAGISPEAVEFVGFEPAGLLTGVSRLHEYRAPAHLQSYPRTWVTVRFTAPVKGPIVLGAGAGLGFGLLAACEH